MGAGAMGNASMSSGSTDPNALHKSNNLSDLLNLTTALQTLLNAINITPTEVSKLQNIDVNIKSTLTSISDLLSNKENSIPTGTNLQYLRGDKTMQTLNTAVVPESSNIYFTVARVLATALTGFVSGAGTVSATDTILQAINKLDGNIALKITLASAITGFVSGAGTVAATDTLIQALNKIDGNINLKAPIANPTFTGTVTLPLVNVNDNITLADGKNVILNTSTGTKIGTATNQKLGLFNATPVIQPASVNQTSLTDSTNSASISGNYTIIDVGSALSVQANQNKNNAIFLRMLNQIRADLVSLGIWKGSA